MLGLLWFDAVVQLRSSIVDTAGFYGTVRGFSRGIERRGVQCRVEKEGKEKEGTPIRA